MVTRAALEKLYQVRNRVPKIIYNWRDGFMIPRLPGAVNATNSEPGPGTRTVVDTTNVLAITGGRVSITGSNAAGDPGIWLSARAREAGLSFKGEITIADATQICEFGFDANQAGALTVNAYRISVDTLLIYDSGAAGPSVYVPLDGIEYKFAIVLRATGAYYFWHDGGEWELIWISATNNTATIYPGFSNSTVLTGNFWNVAIPKSLWLPEPLLSDGFAAANEPDAVDYGGVNDGDYVRVGLSGDDRKAFFDGTNSYCDAISVDVSNKFNGSEGTRIIRARVSDIGIWTDGIVESTGTIYLTGNNRVRNYISNAANTIFWGYYSGGVVTSVTTAGHNDTDWMTLSSTWSSVADEFRAYKNGLQEGATQNGLGVWAAGALTRNVFGSESLPALTFPWSGWLSDAIVLYSVVATPAQMLSIHNHLDAGTLTEQILNTEFGVGNWSWWKLNESFDSDGLGHAEGIAGGIGSGGAGLLYEQPVGAFDYVGNALHCSFVEVAPSGLSLAIAISETKTPDVIITLNATIAAGVCGGTARWIDDFNHLRFYHDGANCLLRQTLAGVSTTLITAVAAYGAANPIRLVLDGINARLYYNNVLIGTTAAISSTLQNSTKHGAYSNGVDNTIDNLTIYARGTNGEYEILESF